MLKKWMCAILVSVFSFGMYSNVDALGDDIEKKKTIYHYDGRTSNTGAPTYITFSSQYRTKEGKLFVFVINATT
mgnify:CR=1 FL=1